MPFSNLNIRDLGGLPAEGGIVREGVLLRSEGPRNFTSDQFAALKGLGIKAIIDLRSANERTEAPHDWQGPDCIWHGLDVNADLRVFGNEGRERLSRGPEPDIAIEAMADAYREIVGALLPHWRVIGEELAAGTVPMLVNCTAGKDRTGVSIALLLEIAGVSREIIMQDYLRSAIFGEKLARSGTLGPALVASYGFMPSPGQVDALIGVRPDYLHAAWAEVDRGWRDVPSYFEHAGLDGAQQRRIRAALVG
jgi:protein-tyrosine phosphatase